MKIEVGKSYRTREGVKVTITEKLFRGQIFDTEEEWQPDGRLQTDGTDHRCDLISPWDQPSSNIADVGDRVTIEGVVSAVTECGDVRVDFENDDEHFETLVPRSAIKSVEPAPPAVGDTVTWGDGNFSLTILGAGDGWSVVRNEDNGKVSLHDHLPELLLRPSFRIVKRRGE